MNKIQTISVIFAGLCLISACSAKVDNRGYSNDEEWKKEIVKGQTTKDEVQARLGSPSARSIFGSESWYYISSRKEAYAFFKPEIVSQDVFKIDFDASGLVASTEEYNQNDSKDFAIATRTTPTEGHTLGFFEQALGNIGRFNAPDTTSGSGIAPGRNPNGHY